MTIQQVFRRTETKYLLTPAEYSALFDIIEPYLKKDIYFESTNCNLYFDTEEHYLAIHSLEHPLYKEKVRLRSYGIPTLDDTVFLELKKKYDGIGSKRRIPLKLSDFQKCLNSKSHHLKLNISNPQIDAELTYVFRRYRLSPVLYLAYPTSNYSVAGAIIGTYNGEGDDALQNRTFTIGDTGEPYQKYGNFYNWTAATLGTSLNTTTGEGGNPEATASICPKGWRLPQSTNIVDKITPIANTNDPDYGKMNKSFLNLIRNYSNPLVGEENAIAGVASFGNTYASVTSLSSGAAGINAYNQIAEFPLNFLHTGYYNRSNGSVGAYALDGDWWSSTASSATHAYHLATWGPGRLIAQNGSHRGIGFTVRCVAR